MEAAMRIAPRPFFALSSLVFIAAAGFCAWKLLPVENGGVMSCSTKAIMRFENMEKENVNGNIHFNFAANGKGSMVVPIIQLTHGFHYCFTRIGTDQRAVIDALHSRLARGEGGRRLFGSGKGDILRQRRAAYRRGKDLFYNRAYKAARKGGGRASHADCGKGPARGFYGMTDPLKEGVEQAVKDYARKGVPLRNCV